MKKAKKIIALLCVMLICAQMFTMMASAATDPYPPLPTLKNGGDWNKYSWCIVKALQRMLNYANNAGLTVDGYFGPKTEKAVKNFQKKYGCKLVDGIVGTETWNKLFSKCQVKSGSKNDMVKLVQTILNMYGYNCGQVDGIFGSKTLKAVKKFQKEWMGSSEVDGIVGPKTWKYLLIAYHYDFD